MILARRATPTIDLSPDLIGARIVALPPTVRRPMTGTVLEIDGYTISIATVEGVIIAVDVEDCRLESKD